MPAWPLAMSKPAARRAVAEHHAAGRSRRSAGEIFDFAVFSDDRVDGDGGIATMHGGAMRLGNDDDGPQR